MLKSLELLKIIYKDCKEWSDKGFAVTYDIYKLKEAIEEIEQTIKTIDDCAGDESDCRIMYEKLYKLINGEER